MRFTFKKYIVAHWKIFSAQMYTLFIALFWPANQFSANLQTHKIYGRQIVNCNWKVKHSRLLLNNKTKQKKKHFKKVIGNAKCIQTFTMSKTKTLHISLSLSKTSNRLCRFLIFYIKHVISKIQILIFRGFRGRSLHFLFDSMSSN